MTRFGGTVVCLSLVASANAGCLLFSDPINRPPTVSITCSQDDVSIPCSPGQEPLPEFVRKTVKFQAVASDPDQSPDTLRFDWYTGKNCNAALSGPAAPPGKFDPPDVGNYCVAVIVTDKQGASAGAQQLFTVVDQAPTADIAIVPAAGLEQPELGQPLMLPLFAKATLTGKESKDLDGDPMTFHWSVYSGNTLISMPGCPDPTKDQYLCTFATPTPGSYRVELVVTDSSEQASKPAAQAIHVAGDQLPNIVLDLVQPAPPFPPHDAPLQLFASLPNTFTIYRVEDDGDPYPSADPSTPYPTPPAGFVWYIQTGSKPFERLVGESGPSYTIRPPSVSPQQSIRLRVEYHDRVTACQPKCGPVFGACDPSATICYSSDLRAQWVTWNVVFQ